MSAAQVHVELVCGGREYCDRRRVESVLSELISVQQRRGRVVALVSGAARGADRLAAEVGRQLGLAVDEFPADWDRFGRAAGYRRNEEMAAFLLSCAEEGMTVGVTAFPGGRGTQHMIDIAARHEFRVAAVDRLVAS